MCEHPKMYYFTNSGIPEVPFGIFKHFVIAKKLIFEQLNIKLHNHIHNDFFEK